MVRLLRGNQRCVAREHEVDTRVGHQVGMELGDVHIQSTVEAQRRSQRGDDLRQQTVQVCVCRALDVQVAAADIVQSLVVDLVGDVCVLEERMDAKYGIVRLNDGCGDLGAAPDGERDLGLLAVIDGKALEQEAAKTGTGTTADGVVDEETLETGAVISELANAIEDKVDNLFTDGVLLGKTISKHCYI